MIRKKFGFTLLELVVTILLTAILVPAIIVPLRTLLIKGSHIELLVSASRLAEMKLEYLSNLDFENVNDIPETAFDPPMETYSFTVDMDYVDGPINLDTIVPSSDFKRVRIDITRAGELCFTMTSLLTNNEYDE
ncbi:MAG: type II secretion system protein [Candidatus Margulisiibacteriota bacterium]